MVERGLSQHRTEAVSVVIGAAASLSAEVDIGHYALAGIIMPGTWTAASLSVHAADVTGGTFVDVFDDDGNQIEIEAAASRAIGIDTDALVLAPWRFIKLESVTIGTPATPVNQDAARTLILVLKAS
jgi:hypothetical protein